MISIRSWYNSYLKKCLENIYFSKTSNYKRGFLGAVAVDAGKDY